MDTDVGAMALHPTDPHTLTQVCLRSLTECLTSDHKQCRIISASYFSRAGLFFFVCLFFVHSLQIIGLFSCRGYP